MHKAVMTVVSCVFMGLFAPHLVPGQGISGQTVTTPGIPADSFFRQEQKSDFSLSPAGNRIACIVHDGRFQNLVIQDIRDGKEIIVMPDSTSWFPPVNQFNKSPYYWINENLLVFCKARTGNPNYMVYAADLNNNEVRCLTEMPDASSSIISARTRSENEILIGCNRRDPKATDIYELNLMTGDIEMIYQDEGGMKIYYTDNAGEIRLARSQAGLLRYNGEKKTFDLVLPAKIGESFLPQAFSADNRSVYAFTNIGRERMALVEYDYILMKEVKVISEDLLYDIWSLEESNDAISETSRLYYSQEHGKLLCLNYYTEKYELVFFDPETKKRFESLKKILGDHEYRLVSYSIDFDNLLFRIGDGGMKGAWYYFDYPGHEAKLIWRMSDWLPEKNIADVRSISFQARDGKKICGYLTVPSGLKTTNVPVIINAHGGPNLRDIPSYNDVNQYFANLGYVVMQINYRGSKGYGNEFEKLGYKQWGLSMQDDITDGVNWLVKEGIADKNRIAIYGFSSGGYNALAGLTFTPGLFACGISISGNVNLFPYYNSIPPAYREIFGDPVKDSIQIAGTSPLFHSERVVRPLMIVTGARDRGIPVLEVDDFVKKLKENGNAVEYLRFENAGHNIIYDRAMKLEVFRKAGEFLDRYMKL